MKRVIGTGDLIMLAIGAVIGAGIFGAIGTAAAGQVGPDGAVIRYGAGPALVFSFILLGGACALAAWIIGWDLILEYKVGNVAVAMGDYFTTLLRGVGIDLPVWLTTGYRTAWVLAPLGMAACIFVMAGLPNQAWERFGWWLAIGLLIYFAYGVRHSRLRTSS